MKPPRKRHDYKSRQKHLAKNVPAPRLQAAAEAASFIFSDYHCRNPINKRVAWRARPGTPCPDHWTAGEARNAVKSAIIKGMVSEGWVKGFPRHIWHERDGVWYEARTTPGTPGEYHGYPVERSELPAGLAI